MADDFVKSPRHTPGMHMQSKSGECRMHCSISLFVLRQAQDDIVHCDRAQDDIVHFDKLRMT